jgi:hypothetical protein
LGRLAKPVVFSQSHHWRIIMKLIPEDIHVRLLQNGEVRRTIAEESGGTREPDFLPVVKLFTPDAGATWLLTEIDPEDTDRAFGLCDLGLGFPELGYVSLSELAAVRGPLSLPVERDRHFAPTKTISTCADEACRCGRIE